MKKILLIFSLLFTIYSAYSKEEYKGIQFFKGTWKALLAEAKKENKPIFVDVYTTWCRPCKVLDKDVFPNEKVGEFYNKNFINYKIDAEKGEGVEIAKKYGVAQYPTLIYLDSKLEATVAEVGILNGEDLIKQGDKILVKISKDKQLSEFAEMYKSKKYDRDFIIKYAKKLSDNNLPTQDILNTYLSQIPENEWNTLKNTQVIGSCISSLNSKPYNVLSKNFVSLVKSREQEESVNSLRNISTIQRREKKRAIEIQDIGLLEKALDLQYLMYGGWSEEGRKDLDIRYGETRRETKIDFYFQGKNWKMYHELCKDYVEKANLPKTNPLLLNSYSRDYFENVDNKTMLKEVLTWVENSLKNDKKPLYQDTYACLLYKLDRKEEAIQEEEKAITKEKANGGDTKLFEENLAKMKDGTFLKK
jgi:thiol-disulfide isomerase/thioredoxin